MKRSIIAACAILVACSQGLSGTYSDQTGMVNYRFESGGKVYLETMGVEAELQYEVDGKKVKIQNPQGGNLILTVLDDGAIQGPMGIKLYKGVKNKSTKK